MRWGIVSTVKAPLREIANFAAYHLDLGAHRLILYLDDDNPQAFEALSTHPRLRVIKADAANWRTAKRPEKHQARQSANATHAVIRKARNLDWLAHIDVDEFLLPAKPLDDQLSALPEDCLAARIHPVEALSGDGFDDIPVGHTYFKATARDRATRNQQTDAIYPTYGPHLNGGFLSHVAGKMIFRTNIEGLRPRIHNVQLGDQRNPGQLELVDTELCHLHAPSLETWLQRFAYRLENGAYRPELAPTRARARGGLTMHELFRTIMDEAGKDGLVAFFNEVCRAAPDLRDRLEQHGLLRCHALGLDTKRAKHFPALA
jgi:hypothetical protein